jgi:hypothetical protein
MMRYISFIGLATVVEENKKSIMQTIIGDHNNIHCIQNYRCDLAEITSGH